MRVLLALPPETGLREERLSSDRIEIFDDDELDGPSTINALLDLTPYLPVLAGSAAATLAAINKSLDEMERLVKRFLPAAAPTDRSGVFENGRRVLAPGASPNEIDAYLSDLKARAMRCDGEHTRA